MMPVKGVVDTSFKWTEISVGVKIGLSPVLCEIVVKKGPKKGNPESLLAILGGKDYVTQIASKELLFYNSKQKRTFIVQDGMSQLDHGLNASY